MTVITHREKRWYYILDEDFEVAKKNGLSKTTVRSRVNEYGWDIDKAITTKARGKHKYRDEWEKFKDIASVHRTTFYSRNESGWSTVRAALLPTLTKKEMAERNRKLSLKDVEKAKSFGVSRRMISYRINKMGMTLEEALTTPKMSKVDAGKIAAKKRWN